MIGYAVAPRARYTPLNGTPAVVDLLADVPVSNGYSRILTLCRPGFEFVGDSRMTVNAELRLLKKGWRYTCEMGFDILDVTTQYSIVSTLIDRLLDPAVAVALSLNAGTTYRDIVFSDRNPVKFTPIGGKGLAGIHVELNVVTRDIYPELPAIGGNRQWW